MTTPVMELERRRELGEVVQLASGGPKMTVTERTDAKGPNSHPVYRCAYFTVDQQWREVLVVEAALVTEVNFLGRDLQVLEAANRTLNGTIVQLSAENERLRHWEEAYAEDAGQMRQYEKVLRKMGEILKHVTPNLPRLDEELGLVELQQLLPEKFR